MDIELAAPRRVLAAQVDMRVAGLRNRGTPCPTSALEGSANQRRHRMWLTFWTVTIAMALIFSVMAQVIQNDSAARGR